MSEQGNGSGPELPSVSVIDTSGFVDDLNGDREPWAWDDLNPFAKGYVEALFAALREALERGDNWCDDEGFDLPPTYVGPNPGFPDLAPATLAQIIADCERRLRHFPSHGEADPYFGARPAKQLADRGALFWADRQASLRKNFPPLTPYLDDDGKVRLRAAVTPGGAA